MDAGMIHITTGSSLTDPGDHVHLMVSDLSGNTHQFTTNIPFRFGGFRPIWGRFLIWGIRNYVKGIK